MGAAGITNYRVSLQQDIACREVWFLEALQHRCHRSGSNIGAVLVLRRERYRKQASVLHIIDPDNTHLFRYAYAHFCKCGHSSSGSEIIRADNGIGLVSQHLPEKVEIVGIAAAYKVLSKRTTV